MTTEKEGKLIAYSVRKYVDAQGVERGWWTAIGRAHVNKDRSLTVYLDALPTGAEPQIVIRKQTPRDASKAPEPESAPPIDDDDPNRKWTA